MGDIISKFHQPSMQLGEHLRKAKLSCKLSKHNSSQIDLKSMDREENTSPPPFFIDIELNDATVDRFLQIQSQLEVFKAEGIFRQLTSAEEEFEIIEKNKQQADIKYKLLSEQCKKEKQDLENISLPTVLCYFRNKKDHDKAISKEEHEYLQSLNLVEIAEKELETINQQYEHAKEKLSNYKYENKKALELYQEQIDILFTLYEGDYGTVFENQLEKEVETLGEHKEILRSSLNKWRNASFLLAYAYNQILYSEQRWKDLINNTKYPEKVISATEVRNNLIAAYQNLKNTKTYLRTVDLPYCTDTDLRTLQNLASRTYDDMMCPEKQRYNLSIIQILRKRCASLNQWFDKVITTILMVDVAEIKAEFDEKSNELKRERTKLLLEKINEKFGKKIDINLLKEIELAKTQEISSIYDSSFIIGNVQNGLTAKSLTDLDMNSFAGSELLPMPSKKEILGDTEEWKKHYQKQLRDWRMKSFKEFRQTSNYVICKKNSL